MTISAEDKLVAMRTSPHGAVGAKAKVPPIARSFMQRGMKILDFGCGATALHVKRHRAEGFDVTAYDFHEPPEGLHDPEAMNRKYDLVYASNVLNVQNSHAALIHTINQLHKATHHQGMMIANLTANPLKGAFEGMKPAAARNMAEELLRRKFDEVNRLPGHHDVWICKKPK